MNTKKEKKAYRDRRIELPVSSPPLLDECTSWLQFAPLFDRPAVKGEPNTLLSCSLRWHLITLGLVTFTFQSGPVIVF